MNMKLDSGGRVGLKAKFLTVATTIALSGVVAFVPAVALADHTTAHTIEQLSAQIAALQVQLVGLSGGSVAPAVASSASCNFTRSLKMGVKGNDVKCLQQYLNGAGYQVAASGVGSPGNETMYFGKATKAAVAKWQAAMGLSPAVGFFGTLSRAKYDSMMATAPVAPAAPAAGGTTPAVSVAVGSGLTVTAAAEQPAAGIVPEGSARVPFVKLVLTASSDGDVKVKTIGVKREGIGDDAAFDGVVLLNDEDGVQIGNAKTFRSDHTVTLEDGLTVKAGTSKMVTVAANMVSSLDNYSGQVPKFTVTGVTAGDTKVNGAFPIMGNGMTLNSTLAIGTVTMSIGSLDPGAANTKTVGTKGYYVASIKASAGSAEDVTFDHIRFNQAGSAAKGDLENVVIYDGTKEYPTTVSEDGKYYIVKFPSGGLKVAKGANVEFSVKMDIKDGSGRTVDMNLLKKSDIVVKGDTYGHYILVGGGSSGAASAGAFSSNQEPFFNAYAQTIDKGSMLIGSSNKVPAGNVPVDVNDTVLGSFTFDVKGEEAQISSLTLNFTFTGTGTSSDITSVKLFDEDGKIVAGPKDPASGVVTWTDTWNAKVGAKVYTIKGKLDTSFVANDTVRLGFDGDNVTAKGVITGLTLSPTPTTLVNANTQTVRVAAVSISVDPTPAAQNVVSGVSGYLFATYVFDAGSSGEDVRVSSIQLRDTASANGVFDELNTCILYDGATALNSGSDVVNPDDPATGTTDDTTFNLTSNLIVLKGTVKKIDLKCNISSSATADSTHSWGTNAAAANINSVGAQTGSAITETITTGTGQVMTVKGAGSFTVGKDASAQTAALILSGKTDVPVNILRYRATNEAINITELTLNYSSSTASTTDFKKVTVWDGATKIGEAVWAGTALKATTTLTAPFIVPKDQDKLMTVKVDVGDVNVTSSSTAGRLLAINYDGISSSTGVGQSSGAKLGSLTSADTAGASFQIMKSIPTVAKIAVPSTTVPQTAGSLYRFSVSADAAGPIALYKFTFVFSSSTVNATSTNLNIYGYSDSAFAVKAYDNNPLSTNDIDCVGTSNMENRNPADCQTSGSGSAYASSTEAVFFFAPVENIASSTEAIVVPAGGTRYFELKGNIKLVGSGTGNSVSVYLDGDAARPVRVTGSGAGIGGYGFSTFWNGSQGQLGSAVGVSSQSANNDFVWSPMSTSTSLTGASSTPDWTNGFLVPGLPATGLSSNSFTN